MIFLFFLFFISSCLANYDNMLTQVSVNISQSAYCLSTVDSWSCATCSNQNIFETKLIDNNVLIIFGYNTFYNSLFIGFRGSSNIQNWIDNIQIKQIKPYSDKNIAVEKGTYNLYSSIHSDIYSILDKMVKKYNTNDILITGHSLGGALATISAFEMMYLNTPYNVKYLITFGSPRVGNDYFFEYFNYFNIYSKRITHYFDIVPHLPEMFFGYKHISNEIWFDEINNKYTICNDEFDEDPSCSNSCAPLHCTSTTDHLNYMNISMGNDGLC